MILEKLLTDGMILDVLGIFGEDLEKFSNRISNLFVAVDSIEKFWAVPSIDFNQLTLDIRIAIDQWSNTYSSESILWRLISLKTKAKYSN